MSRLPSSRRLPLRPRSTSSFLVLLVVCFGELSEFRHRACGFSQSKSIAFRSSLNKKNRLDDSRLNMVSQPLRNSNKDRDDNSNKKLDADTSLGSNFFMASYAKPDLPRSPSPSTVFGRPIDASTKETNKQFISTAKSWLFDIVFQGQAIERSYARFYALETIARMPYFSYLSVLHLYETLGWWRRAEYLRIHFAETWNELHHLLIMEQLLDDTTRLSFQDKFIAQHIAFFYYWMVVGLYMVNPTHAYHLNQCVEEEAYQTYDKFITKYEDYLKQQPAPSSAIEYYTGDDLYLFDQMHTHGGTKCDLPNLGKGAAQSTQQQQQQVLTKPPLELRRPPCQTLYDTFVNIRDDEWEHVKTMAFLQVEEEQQHNQQQ